MRILVLVTDAFGGRGGIAKFNRDLITALCSQKDCEEVVAIPRIIPDSINGIPSRLSYITDGTDSIFKYVVTVIKNVWGKAKYDLILCAHIHLLPLARVLSLFTKAPLLLVLYGIDAWKPTNRWFSSHCTQRVNYFLWISEFTKKSFLTWNRLDNRPGFVLTPCVQMNEFDPELQNQDFKLKKDLKGNIVLMTLGRLAGAERNKGFDEVVEVMPQLIKEVPNIVYMIVGDGKDRKRLEEKSKRLGVSKRVIFTGYVPEREKADYYRLADCFVMPGRGEGFGIVYLEAMACGVPVVASKADGSREAIKDGELGILVDPSNPQDIKRGILEALKRPKGVIPEGLDYFSYENFEKKVHAIIDQVVPKMEALT